MNQDPIKAVDPAAELAAGMAAAADRTGLRMLGATKCVSFGAYHALAQLLDTVVEGRIATAFFVDQGKPILAVGVATPAGGVFPLSFSLDFQSAVPHVHDAVGEQPAVEIDPEAVADLTTAVLVALVTTPLFLAPMDDGFSAWVFALDGESPASHAPSTLPIAQVHRHPPGRPVHTTEVKNHAAFGPALRARWQKFSARLSKLHALGTESLN
jgi:hypothetical protein